MNAQTYDDLDDGAETLAGYRSVLTGPTPTLAGHKTWAQELAALGQTIAQWKREQAEAGATGSAGRIAIAVAERDKVNEVRWALKRDHGIDCAELTKDGPRGAGAEEGALTTVRRRDPGTRRPRISWHGTPSPFLNLDGAAAKS